jgi:hypothetical protein
MAVAYTNAEGRQQVLDDLASALDQVDLALDGVSGAYELLDDAAARRVEDQLFRPSQSASAQLRRTRSEFAARHDLSGDAGERQPPHAAPGNAGSMIQDAAAAATRADLILGGLQDSLLPIVVGDRELRRASSASAPCSANSARGAATSRARSAAEPPTGVTVGPGRVPRYQAIGTRPKQRGRPAGVPAIGTRLRKYHGACVLTCGTPCAPSPRPHPSLSPCATSDWRASVLFAIRSVVRV